MATFRQHAEALARTEGELRAEIASSLGRVARVLEAALDELTPLDQKLRGASASAGDAERHEVLRRRAETYRWYLIVQREAIGLRHHGDIEDRYVIPRRLERAGAYTGARPG